MFVALQCAGISCVMGVAAKICKMDKSLRSNVASSSSRCIKEKCIVSRIVLEEKEKIQHKMQFLLTAGSSVGLKLAKSVRITLNNNYIMRLIKIIYTLTSAILST